VTVGQSADVLSCLFEISRFRLAVTFERRHVSNEAETVSKTLETFHRNMPCDLRRLLNLSPEGFKFCMLYNPEIVCLYALYLPYGYN
jgi:hypothetical protein